MDTLYTHPDGTTVQITSHTGGVFLSVLDGETPLVAIRFEADVLEAVGAAILTAKYPALAPLIERGRA